MRNVVLGICCAVLALTIGFSFWWFTVENGQSLSSNMALWGSYGSFLAGSIGVTFGLATVWMLAETLKIQRQELKDTRSELESTRKVHEQSAKNLQQQYELMLADYRRRNFKEYIDNMLSPIDVMQGATKVSQNNTWTFFDAVKNNRLERFFENEIRVMVHQFVIIADTYSDENLSVEDKVYLEKEISRYYYLFAHAKKSGYFNKCGKGTMHELWKFYCRVNARVEGTDSK